MCLSQSGGSTSGLMWWRDIVVGAMDFELRFFMLIHWFTTFFPYKMILHIRSVDTRSILYLDVRTGMERCRPVFGFVNG